MVIKLDAVEVTRGITNGHLARILVIFKDSGDQFIDIEHVWACVGPSFDEGNMPYIFVLDFEAHSKL